MVSENRKTDIVEEDAEEYEEDEFVEEEYESEDEDFEEDEAFEDEEEEENPLEYHKVQQTTNDLNDIYQDGVAVAKELKEAYNDIASIFDPKSWFK